MKQVLLFILMALGGLTGLHAAPAFQTFDLNGNLEETEMLSSKPVLILAQPQSRTTAPGDPVSVSVVVAGGPFTYQWKKDGATIGGAVSDTHLIPNFGAGDVGAYTVMVTPTVGSVVESDPAQLYIDTDGDGLGDSWETDAFSDLTVAGGGDNDADGQTNLEEFLDGTDPNDAESLKIQLILSSVNGSINVSPLVGDLRYTPGTLLNLTAVPKSGYELSSWEGAYPDTAPNEAHVVVGNVDTTVAAHFVPEGTATTLAEALDASLTFTTGGDGNWIGEASTAAHDKIDSARSPSALGRHESAWIETTVTGPGTLTYWWRSDAHDEDGLTLSVNSMVLGSLVGANTWQFTEIHLPAGSHTVRWTYDREEATSELRSNAARLDEITWMPGTDSALALAIGQTDAVLATSGHLPWIGLTQYAPIALTGFDKDVMVGSGDSEGGSGSVWTAVTDESMDGGVLREIAVSDFNNTYFPEAGRLSAPDAEFQLADDSGPNALYLSDLDTRTLTLSSPGSWRSLQVLGFAVGGDAEVMCELEFTDGARQATPMLVRNWDRSDEVEHLTFSTYSPTTGARVSSSRRLHAATLPVSPEHWGRTLAYITFRPTGAEAGDYGNAQGMAILALSGANGATSVTDSVATSGRVGLDERSWLSLVIPGDHAVSAHRRIPLEGPSVVEMSGSYFLLDGVAVPHRNGEWDEDLHRLGSGDHVLTWLREPTTEVEARSIRIAQVQDSMPISLGQATDNALSWTSGGDAPWQGFDLGLLSTDGADVAMSGEVLSNCQSWIETSFVGPGTLSWNWRLSGESRPSGRDSLSLEVNGESVHSFEGSLDWESALHTFGAGTHTVRWTFQRSHITPENLNAAFLDEVIFTSGTPALTEALDLPDSVKLYAYGKELWASQSTVTNDGTDAAVAAPIDRFQKTILQLRVEGPLTLAYWRRVDTSGSSLSLNVNGDQVIGNSGLHEWAEVTYPLGPGPQVIEWTYNQSSAPVGAPANAWIDQVSLRKSVPLLAALDAPAQAWTSGGSGGWTGEEVSAIIGASAAVSGSTPHSSQSWIETQVTGPGLASFYWNISAANGDEIRFLVDGDLVARRAGDGATWQEVLQTIPAGTHTLRWSYAKNASGSSGSDAASLDAFVFTPEDPVVFKEAIESPPVELTSTGTDLWFNQTATTHDGVDALQSGGVTDNERSALSTQVTGPGLMSYWWKSSSHSGDVLRLYLDQSSVNSIAGEQDWEQVVQPIPEGKHVVEWAYEMNWTTSGGMNTSWIDEVKITTPATLDDSLDQSGLTWTTGGDGEWVGVNGASIAHDSADAAYSGVLAANASAWLETEITGPGTLEFWWRPSGSSGDTAEFYVDGVLQLSEGGDPGWRQVQRILGSGAHTLRWVYSKDGNAPVGSDALFLDEVSLTPGMPLMDGGELTTASLLTHGDELWASQTTISHDGTDALQAGPIGDNEEARLETTVTGPGTLAYWWKVSSEGSGDRVRLYINNTQITSTWGEADWGFVRQSLGEGAHVISWRYTKNGGGAGGSDTAWLDEIEWAPASGNLAGALDSSGLVYSATSSPEAATWMAQDLSESHDGVDAAVTPRLEKLEWTSMETLVNGAGTLSFWWRSIMASGDRLRVFIDGEKRHELTTTTEWQPVACTVGSGTHTIRWEWERGTGNSNASQGGWVDEVSFISETTPSLEDAIDASGLLLTSSGDALWFDQSTTTNDGADAAQSGAIGDSEQTWFQTNLTGPGTLTYWRKISSQSSDRLRLYVDGVAISSHNFSGEQDWAQQTYDVPGGSHVVQWRYAKNGSVIAGDDTAWIDEVVFTPSTAAETLANALDGSGLTWTTSVSDAWTGLTGSNAHDGVDFARSGEPGNGSSSWIETPVTGPGTLRFWWRAVSSAEDDALRLLVDGTFLTEISGATDWQLIEATIGAGTHTMRWDYSPTSGDANASRRMEIDDVSFTTEATPSLLASAASDGSTVGSIVAMVSSGYEAWVTQATNTHDGVSAPESGPITHNQSTWVEAVIDGPGKGSFWWNVDSQTSDIASLTIDGESMDTRSGTGLVWEKPEYYLDAGRHHVRVTYTKNQSVHTGLDRAWTDEWMWSASVPNVMGDALELANQALVTYGSQPWFSQTAVTHDGTDALQTGGISHNEQSALSINAEGPGWVFYWWKVSSQSSDRLRYYQDGVQVSQLSGEQDWQFVMRRSSASTRRHVWQYEKNGSVDGGDDSGYLDGVEFAAPEALEPALDALGLTWTTGGDAPWAGYTSSHASDGTDAASSGEIGHNESSWLETTVMGPGILTFDTKILAHSSDPLMVSINAIEQGALFTATDWQASRLDLGAGTHTVRWTFSKNGATTTVPDAAWLDNVTWTPTAAPGYSAALDSDDAFVGAGSALWFDQVATTHDGVDALQAGPIGDSEQTSFYQTVEGPAVLSFWWKVSSLSGDWVGWYLDGTLIDWRQGDQDWENISREIGPGRHVLEWRYTKNGSGSALDDTAWVDELEIVPYQSDYSDALDASGLTWITGGAAPWSTLALGAAQNDSDLAVNGSVPTGQESWIETTVTGPGQLSYWTKTSTHGDDALVFTADDIEWNRKAGTNDWQQSILTLPIGDHTLRWSWQNLSTASGGSNQVWLDNVSFVQTAAPPLAAALNNMSTSWFSTGSPWGVSDVSNSYDGVGSAQSGAIGDNANSSIKTRVTGPAWLSFQWNVSSDRFDYHEFFVDGVELDQIGGEPGWALYQDAIGSGEHILEWRYHKNFNTVDGQDLAFLDQVTITPYIDFDEALDAESLTWTSGGAGWAGIANADASHDGIDTAVSLLTAPGQESWMETTVTGPGTVRFWWRTDTGADDLQFLIDGALQTDIDFINDWTEVIASLSGGTHTLRWTYKRTTNDPTNADTAFVDEVRFIPSDPKGLDVGLDQAGLTLSSYGDSNPWNFTATENSDGMDAIEAGVTQRNGESTLQAEVQGPALIAFDWKIDAHAFDRLSFRVEHTNYGTRSGSNEWASYLARVPAGKYDLFWIFEKNRDYELGHSAWLDRLEVSQAIDLATALDGSGLIWTTGGDAPWAGHLFSQAHDGTDLAASGSVDSGEVSWLETQVFGPGTLDFRWKAPAYAADGFTLSVDGIRYLEALGAEDWASVEVAVSAGTHTIRWEQNVQGFAGDGGVWVDEVQFTADSSPPLFDAFDVPIRAAVASGSSGWESQSIVARDGNGALEATPLPDQASAPEVIVAELAGPGELTFWHQTAAHEVQAVIDSETLALTQHSDWAPTRYPLGNGSHRLRFAVTQSGASSGPVRIDQISVSMIASIALAEALDATGLPWTTSAALPWIGLSDPAAISSDGSDSGMSSNETPIGVPSWVETEVTGPGTIGFHWKVPTGEGNRLAFYIDGLDQSLSNPQGAWAEAGLPVPSGTHTLRWSAFSPGTDAVQSAGLDQVTWSAGYQFTDWQDLHFTAAEQLDPLVSGPNADADADGLSNAVESVLGLDPRMHSPLALDGSAENSDWIFTFTVASVIPTDMAVHFDQSVLLASGWAAAADHNGANWVPVAPATLTEMPMGPLTEVIVRMPSVGNRLFGRIRAVQIP